MWLAMASRESLKGKPSTRQSTAWRAIMPYMRRERSFLLMTECSSTSSER
jgi:hypothetical protein